MWHKTRRQSEKHNNIIREMCGCELSLLERIERNVLKWFEHVEKMGEEMLVKGV